MKKVWCRHIEDDWMGELNRYMIVLWQQEVLVPSTWQCCPICKTLRPKQATKRKKK